MRRILERIGPALVVAGIAGAVATPAAVATDSPRAAERQAAVAGVPVRVDAATGRLQQPTAEEARRLAVAMRAMFSPAPLAAASGAARQAKSADGTLSYLLGGDSLNVSLARFAGDGTVSQVCVDNYDAAMSFLLGAPALEEK